MVKAQQKRNTIITCTLATILVLLVAITLGNMVRGEARSLEKVTYPTSFKLSQSDTKYSFSELTYIMRDKDKAHYYVMEPEYYYYHWAEINIKIQYPEKEDPLVYWEDKSWFSYENNYIHIYEDSALSKLVDIPGSEFASISYFFDDNYTNINFKLGDILDLLDEHGDSQNYYIAIDPFLTATTTHEGSQIVIEFKYKDTEYVTTKKSHSTTSNQSGLAYTVIDTDERDPVSQGIHVYQPSKYRTSTTSRTYSTTASTTKTTSRTTSTTRTTTKSATSNVTSTTASHEHDWIIKYNGTPIYNDLARFCQCPVCDMQFKDRTLLESHAYWSGHKLSDDPVKDTRNTAPEKSSVIVGYSGDSYYVCKICGKTSINTETEEMTLNGLVQGPDGKWAMYNDGVVNTNYTGIAKNSYGWWRVEKGYVNFNAQGIYKNDYGWWKTTNGKVTFDETGVFKNEFGWWRVEKSKVNFKANGIYKNQYGWWKTTKGKVTFKETGVFKNDYGWWRVEKSKVNFKANGLYKNEYGTWYVKNGKVDFNYNGTYQGKTIKGGKVQ